MVLDPTKHADWEIAQEAESRMKTCYQLADALGLTKEELLPHGDYVAKVDYMKVLQRLKDRPDGKFIEVTAITPTPLGEGKSTTTMGLLQGIGKRGKKVVACIRQPSGGPTMNIKGSAAGGGLSQCVPLTEFSLGLTGDINAVMNAHNLAMVAPDRQAPTRAELRRPAAGQEQPQTAGYRSHPRGNGLGDRLLFSPRPCETSSSASAAPWTAT